MGVKKLYFPPLVLLALLVFLVFGLLVNREAQAATLQEVKEKAIGFLYREYTQNGMVNSEVGVGSYALYVLKEAGVDIGSWTRNGVTLREAVINAVKQDISRADQVRAKFLVHDLMAMRVLGESALTDQLMEVLKKRQTEQGFEDWDSLSVYSNIPSFELLGRVGLLGEINIEWAKKYLLDRQYKQENSAYRGSWGAGDNGQYYADFMVTAMAVRALHYLDPQKQDASIQKAIENGLSWLKKQQKPDGSFVAGMDDPVIDTAEAVVTLKLLGIDPASWRSNEGKSAVDYLLNSALNPDGSFGTCGNAMDATWVLWACLALERTGGPGQMGGGETPQKVISFTDLKGHWAEEVINRLAGMGIVSGYPDGTFRPEEKVTRYELAAMLVRFLKPEPVTRSDLLVLDQKFKDALTIPSWARESVAAAFREGIMTGYPQPDGTLAFSGEEAVSRAEMAAVLSRIITKRYGEVTPRELDFADTEEIPHWAKEAIGIAYAKGIVGGYPDHTFQASRKVSRAEAAAMLLRLAEALGGK